MEKTSASPQDGYRLAVVVACNNEGILNANLRRSPIIAEGRVPLHVEWHAPSAAVAYNRGLEATDSELVIFAHQDVFLPRGWEVLLRRRIAALERRDPNWALVGSFGIGLDGAGYGPVWVSSIGYIDGRVRPEPVPVQGFDEHLIVMRRRGGLKFDEDMPSFHLFGTDIVQAARKAGLGAYAVALPLVHNDRYKDQFGSDFVAAYRFMQRKWRSELPLRTSVIKISWHGLHLVRARWHNAKSRAIRQNIALPTSVDPRVYASFCSWNDLSLASEIPDATAE